MRPLLRNSVLLLVALTACNGWSPTAPGGASLFGTVTNAQYGYRVSGAEVVLLGPGGGTSQSNGDGGYSFHRLEPGRFQLLVYYGPAGGQLYVRTDIDIRDGANVHDIAL